MVKCTLLAVQQPDAMDVSIKETLALLTDKDMITCKQVGMGHQRP